MANSQEDVADILDRLERLGGVTVRAMFGGHGFYRDGEIFACLDKGEFYLKVDPSTLKRFEALGSRPFQPMGAKGPAMKSYWLVPTEVLDDPHELVDAVRASLKGRAKK